MSGSDLHVVEVVGLLASSGHRYDGRPGTTPEQAGDRRERLEIRAGFGVVGDRYAGRPAHRDASVTVIAAEPLHALAAELGVPPFVVLRGGRPANPCAWMDVVLAPQAHRGIRGRGGIRCSPETGGVLRLGPAVLMTAQPGTWLTRPPEQ